MVFADFFNNTVKQKPVTAVSHKGDSSRKSSKQKGKQNRSRRHEKRPAKEQNEGSTHTRTGESKRSPKKRSRPPKNNTASKRFKYGPPSSQALALSATLKDLSSRKRLREALDTYWDPSNDEIRDGHHGCIMVDCCARCGSIEKGEEVIKAMKENGTHISVETRTALLKGYAHSGMMKEGSELFREMCLSNAKRDRPNVRTLNTLLRGCMWTAASVTVDEKGRGSRPATAHGGVVTSEEAWSLYFANQNKKQPTTAVVVDASSYEYSIVLLCQALLCTDALSRIEEMKQLLGITADCTDGSTLESFASCLLSQSRSYALLGRISEGAATAKSALEAAHKAMALSRKHDGSIGNQDNESDKGRMSKGGKRAWRGQGRDVPSSNGGTDNTRRTISNSLFRSHRLSEICSECNSILQWCSKDSPTFSSKDLVFFLLTRLLYFSGGGTTEMSSTLASESGEAGVDSSVTRLQLLNSAWISFGLQAAFESSTLKAILPSKLKTLGEDDCDKLRSAVGVDGASIINDERFIEFDHVFAARGQAGSAQSDNNRQNERRSDAKRPLCIELGAGYGDWIVTQARANPTSEYVAVELRADRVAQTFSKAMFNNGGPPLTNLCCVGSECGTFLRSRVKKGTVSTIFVNHPEPPTQTFGSHDMDLADIANGSIEPAHMLNSETILSAVHCLGNVGKLVIVTDNRWYARLICATVLKVIRANKGLLQSMSLNERGSGLRQIEVFPHSVGVDDDCERICLFEGQPSTAIGHSEVSPHGEGTSYFDRLWRSGAGSHAESKKRFVIAVERSWHEEGKKIAIPLSSSKPGANQRKKRKKSEAKQRRRNERRLMKRGIVI